MRKRAYKALSKAIDAALLPLLDGDGVSATITVPEDRPLRDHGHRRPTKAKRRRAWRERRRHLRRHVPF